MAMLILHSPHRSSRTALLLAFVLVAISIVHGQASSKATEQGAPSHTRITEWENDVSGAFLFLHQVFPDMNAKSKSIVQNNLEWRMSPGGMAAFRIDVCEPDVPNQSKNEEEARDFFAHSDVQCSVLTIQADFLMTGSQLGPVPAHIFVWRPNIEKHRSELGALLLAHPKWSGEQVDKAMKEFGVKYGKDAHDEVIGLVHEAWPKLEMFFGKLTLDSMEYFPPLLTEPKLPAGPSWIIKAHPSDQDPSKLRNSYTFVFNSFDGAFESEMIGP